MELRLYADDLVIIADITIKMWQLIKIWIEEINNMIIAQQKGK